MNAEELISLAREEPSVTIDEHIELATSQQLIAEQAEWHESDPNTKIGFSTSDLWLVIDGNEYEPTSEADLENLLLELEEPREECGACGKPATWVDNGEPVCGSHSAMHVYGFSHSDFI